MATIGLSAYTLRLRKRHSHEIEWLTMSKGGNVDVWKMLHTHFLARKNQVVDIRDISAAGSVKPVSRAFKLTQLKADEDAGTFRGVFESGDYGRASTIVNIQTGKEVHHKSTKEADMPPFYFRIQIPDGATTAVVVAQRLGAQGLKSAIEADLTKYFAGLDFTCRMGTLTDNDLLESYLTHGTVEDIRVVTHAAPADARDAIKYTKINGEKPKDGTKIEISLSHKKGLPGVLKTAAGAFRRTKNVRDLVEIYGLENPEEVSFQVENDGVRKMFRIMHPSEIGIKYDITKEVDYNDDNHPTFDSIDRLARDWCKTLTRQVNTSA